MKSYKMSDFKIGMEIVITGLFGESEEELTIGNKYKIIRMDDSDYDGSMPICVIGDNNKHCRPSLSNFEIVEGFIQDLSFGFNKATFEKWIETLKDNSLQKDEAESVLLSFCEYIEPPKQSKEEIEAISLLTSLGYSVNKGK